MDMSPTTFEGRLVSLAERGFRAEISVSVPGYGKHAGKTSFSARLSKGDAYGADGTGSMNVTGMGLTLEEAIGSALRAGEAFLGDPEPPQAVTAALVDIGAPRITAQRDAEHAASPAGRLAAEIEGPAADVMGDGDPLKLVNREKHREAAQAGDRVRAGEDLGALG